MFIKCVFVIVPFQRIEMSLIRIRTKQNLWFFVFNTHAMPPITTVPAPTVKFDVSNLCGVGGARQNKNSFRQNWESKCWFPRGAIAASPRQQVHFSAASGFWWKLEKIGAHCILPGSRIAPIAGRMVFFRALISIRGFNFGWWNLSSLQMMVNCEIIGTSRKIIFENIIRTVQVFCAILNVTWLE